MDRKITYYFYKIKIDPKETRNLETILNDIAKLSFSQRERDVEGSTVRLEEFKQASIRGVDVWQGMISQFRENKLPSKVKKGKPLESLGLHNDESIAEPTGFAIIPSKKVLVYSKILSGVALGRFAKYILQSQLKGPIEFKDIVLPDVLENLKEHTWFNKLKLSFKLPVGNSSPSTKSDSVQAGIEAAGQTGALGIEIILKAGRKKNDTLDPRKLIEEAETILAEQSGAGYLLEALEAFGKKNQGDKSEKIPLLNWRMHSEQTIHSNQRTLTWKLLQDSSRAAVAERIDEL